MHGIFSPSSPSLLSLYSLWRWNPNIGLVCGSHEMIDHWLPRNIWMNIDRDLLYGLYVNHSQGLIDQPCDKGRIVRSQCCTGLCHIWPNGKEYWALTYIREISFGHWPRREELTFHGLCLVSCVSTRLDRPSASSYSRKTQFMRDQENDSEEIVWPLMQDGTYLSRNFATLGSYHFEVDLVVGRVGSTIRNKDMEGWPWKGESFSDVGTPSRCKTWLMGTAHAITAKESDVSSF